MYISMNALYQTSISFTSQNLGAKNYHRIDQTLVRCMCIVTLIGLVLGNGAHLLGNPLLHIYSQDPEVIAYGMQRFSVVSVTYFLCGMMDVGSGVVRGLGYSIMPMLVSMVGACVFRVIWIFTVFRMYHTLFTLYVSYPISWVPDRYRTYDMLSYRPAPDVPGKGGIERTFAPPQHTEKECRNTENVSLHSFFIFTNAD